ncbi:TIGR02530 family flagellar biosynthesis protein [Parablautia muri]|uniref:Flagellar protein n=1 Tax=Parablautia muri TaxID=2320879 RepID=A0A9X5BG82_9FIRM|nr:TIGR02530 family flagellar biosynthesis protein [Parablautia muri]NBJ93511.1 flagellar protein [Parablautia muri]
MQVQNKGYLSIEQLQDQYLKQNKSGTSQVATDGQSFQEILENSRARAQGQVRFSKHAAGRLADRNIELTSGQMERLQEGAQKAQMKGIKESLVIVDQLAFIVNIPNNTVVTAMNQQDAAENVFTNIDGAVII